jgi:hypothetical protein
MREDMGGFGCGSVSKMYAGPPNELTVLRVYYKTLKEIGYAASLLLLLHQKSINGHESYCFEEDIAHRIMFVSLLPKKKGNLRNYMAGVRCVGVS